MAYMQQNEPKQQRPGLIGRFLSAIWNIYTWLRNALFNILFLLVIVIIFAAVSTDDTDALPDTAALRIAPSGFLVDQRSYTDPMTQVLQQNSPDQIETLVRDVTRAINAATTDPRITGIVLEPSYLLGGGISKLNEIGQALLRFKQSGKPIIAVGDTYSQDQYYLASFADEIHLHPQGSLFLTGYGSYRNYYKSALDKLEISYHIFKVGTYKDFVEPYIRDNMSAASKEHNGQWLQELWAMYTAQVETRRALSPDTINNYINNIDQKMAAASGNSAQLALDIGLVDRLSDRQKTVLRLQEQFGLNDEEQSYAAIQLSEYNDLLDLNAPPYGDKVGLIVASGTILDGVHPEGTIGGDSLAQLFRDARQDDDIKALVLRIDSGGGSAFASEIIREQIQVSRDQGMPVIVSMGSVAASGGYWIATASDKVFATPATITGSIGVFGAFPTLENTLGNLGIYTDGLGTTKLAGSMRLDRPLSPLAANVIQQGVEHIYGNFINLVASARQSTPEEIDKIAQGRVWSGLAAQKINLVDELGYLDDAINAAAQLAKLKQYEVFEVRKTLSPAEAFLQQLATADSVRSLAPKQLINSFAPASLRHALAPIIEPFKQFDAMNDPRGVYVQCTGCVAP